jgi:NAD(P)-dependent dehydrogenase (short-subunit alcohol dehydrogenase family)
VVGNFRLFNIFLPLIKNGQTKKVVTISSGNTDEKLTVEFELFEAAPYSISKSAMNMVTAKFQAEFKKEGIIFMGVAPGNVNTGHFDNRKYTVCKAYCRIIIEAVPHSHTGKSAKTYGHG